MRRMYKENVKSLNWFVGCRHNCVYCKPSFQAQMKRQRKNCISCYWYEPHPHLERLAKTPPHTRADEFIFFPSSGDPAYATREQFHQAWSFAEKYPDRTFLTQSKDPFCFLQFSEIPDNVILGTTIETDLIQFPSSTYYSYDEISHAPFPVHRVVAMSELKHKRKEVTIEPILEFSLATLPEWIREINPEFVYVGYDNHNCKLPEPPLSKTHMLIEKLEKFTEVRVKTLRKAWWEP